MIVFSLSFSFFFPPVPVRKVDLKQAENKISCRSDGIFPKPELSWSTSPQSNMSIQSPVTSSQSEPLLYSISSSLTLSDDAGDLTYICTVSTRRSSRKTSLKTLRKYKKWCLDFIYIALIWETSSSKVIYILGSNLKLRGALCFL